MVISAWNCGLVQVLLNLPESPSTKYNSFYLYFYFVQVLILPDSKVSLRLFFLPERASSRALRAASLACCALIAFYK